MSVYEAMHEPVPEPNTCPGIDWALLALTAALSAVLTALVFTLGVGA